MNNTMISQRQAEQAEVEQTEEYVLEQRMLYFDSLLERINALLKKSHEDDRQFNRYLRKIHRSSEVVLCDECRREVTS